MHKTRGSIGAGFVQSVQAVKKCRRSVKYFFQDTTPGYIMGSSSHEDTRLVSPSPYPHQKFQQIQITIFSNPNLIPSYPSHHIPGNYFLSTSGISTPNSLSTSLAISYLSLSDRFTTARISILSPFTANSTSSPSKSPNYKRILLGITILPKVSIFLIIVFIIFILLFNLFFFIIPKKFHFVN